MRAQYVLCSVILLATILASAEAGSLLHDHAEVLEPERQLSVASEEASAVEPFVPETTLMTVAEPAASSKSAMSAKVMAYLQQMMAEKEAAKQATPKKGNAHEQVEQLKHKIALKQAKYRAAKQLKEQARKKQPKVFHIKNGAEMLASLAHAKVTEYDQSSPHVQRINKIIRKQVAPKPKVDLLDNAFSQVQAIANAQEAKVNAKHKEINAKNKALRDEDEKLVEEKEEQEEAEAEAEEFQQYRGVVDNAPAPALSEKGKSVMANLMKISQEAKPEQPAKKAPKAAKKAVQKAVQKAVKKAVPKAEPKSSHQSVHKLGQSLIHVSRHHAVPKKAAKVAKQAPKKAAQEPQGNLVDAAIEQALLGAQQEEKKKKKTVKKAAKDTESTDGAGDGSEEEDYAEQVKHTVTDERTGKAQRKKAAQEELEAFRRKIVQKKQAKAEDAKAAAIAAKLFKNLHGKKLDASALAAAVSQHVAAPHPKPHPVSALVVNTRQKLKQDLGTKAKRAKAFSHSIAKHFGREAKPNASKADQAAKAMAAKVFKSMQGKPMAEAALEAAVSKGVGKEAAPVVKHSVTKPKAAKKVVHPPVTAAEAHAIAMDLHQALDHVMDFLV